jgi:GNAT superfamily N-acetyltransferase
MGKGKSIMKIRVLNNKNIAGYTKLTYPCYRKLLSRAVSDGPVVALGYEFMGTAYALALGIKSEDKNGYSQLISVFVDRNVRSRGIGTALLEQMEKEMATREATWLWVQYSSDNPSTPALEKVLLKRSWEKPECYLTTFKVIGKDVYRIMQAPWMYKALPSDYEIVLWQETTKAQRQAGLETVNKLILEGRSPMLDGSAFDPDVFEPVNSTGFLYKGRLVGGMLTRRYSPGVILYDRLFLSPECQGRNLGMPLVGKAIQYQYRHDRHIPDWGGIWKTRMNNGPMMKLNRHFLGPYVTQALTTKASKKRLFPESN